MWLQGVNSLLNVLIFRQAFAYTPDWPSLDRRPLPRWYDEAKVGVFMHWGPYTVPGVVSEWFWVLWERNDPNVMDYVNKFYPPTFRYQELGQEFRGEFFNATRWVEVVAASGAKYYVFTSKHHDGFNNWPSTRNFGWNSVEVGPKKDIVGELADAFRKQGKVRFGLYYSLFEWFHPLYIFDKAANYTTRKFVENKMWPDLKELITKYKPHLLWSDGDWETGPEYWKSLEFLAWLYNSSPVRDVIVTNDRWGNSVRCHHGDFLNCDDKYNPGVLQKHKWENAMSIDRRSWGHRRNMELADILSMEELTATLAQTVSCGGNILMNVGPTSQGTIEPVFEERLRGMGQWLEVNGAAIYGSRPWLCQNDTVSSNVWYTSKPSGGSVYAIVTRWPGGGKLQLGCPEVGGQTEMTMLGYDDELRWAKAGKTVVIQMPKRSRVGTDWAWVIEMKFLANGHMWK